jgi:predicted DNA-binding ribbon-helix-helix protein
VTAEGPAGELLRRSFRIAGHRTSLSMERAFWQALRDLARADGRTMTALIAGIDADRDIALSRAVRVYILQRLRNQTSKGDSP